MHDPMTVAFEIKYPWKDRPSRFWPEGYRRTFLTIWHVDPERDGSDDSCGWFKRAHHGDQAVLKSIRNDFEYAWDGDWGGWFNADGSPYLSPIGITLGMFRLAAWNHFRRDHRKVDRFFKLHLYDILSFAENNVDSMHPGIVQRYGPVPRDERIANAAKVIYGCVLRWTQPWYGHARWHVHHWRIQLHPWQQLRRRFWDRCCRCGKRGFPKGVSAIGNWDGDRIWHSTCDDSAKPAAVVTDGQADPDDDDRPTPETPS